METQFHFLSFSRKSQFVPSLSLSFSLRFRPLPPRSLPLLSLVGSAARAKSTFRTFLWLDNKPVISERKSRYREAMSFGIQLSRAWLDGKIIIRLSEKKHYCIPTFLGFLLSTQINKMRKAREKIEMYCLCFYNQKHQCAVEISNKVSYGGSKCDFVSNIPITFQFTKSSRSSPTSEKTVFELAIINQIVVKRRIASLNIAN